MWKASRGYRNLLCAACAAAVGVAAAAAVDEAGLKAAREALSRGDLAAAIAAADSAGARSLDAPEALLIRGRARLYQGRFEDAVADLTGVAELDSAGSFATMAQYDLALAVLALGDVTGALNQLQRLRDSAPDRPEAAAALNVISTIYRVRFRAPQQGGNLQFDPEYAAGGSQLDKPVALLAIGSGDLSVADSKAHKVLRFDPQGRAMGEIAATEPLALFREDGGGVGIVGKKEVHVLGDVFQPVALREGKRDQLDNLIGGVRLTFGDLLLLDSKAKVAVRFDSNHAYVGDFAPSFAEPDAVATDPFGRVALLAEKRRVVALFDAAGNQVAALAAGGSFAEPVAITFDLAGQLYVLDKSGPKVAVFDAGLKPAGRVNLRSEYGEPIALAVDSTGRLLVLDRKRKLVTRYQ